MRPLHAYDHEFIAILIYVVIFIVLSEHILYAMFYGLMLDYCHRVSDAKLYITTDIVIELIV